MDKDHPHLAATDSQKVAPESIPDWFLLRIGR
jgi:hypothetical protein